MGQTWTTDCFAGAHEAQTDLQNMETNFATLKSLFSGTSAPANTVAGMPWFDTTKKALKIRNTADAAWVGLMHGDTSQKLWVYRNAAMDGWAIDSGVTDKVLGLKGGATYTAGAATAGSWTVSGITNANESTHTHAGGTHTHSGAGDAPSATTMVQGPTNDTAVASPTHTHSTTGNNTANNTGAGVAHTHVASQDATWRAAAAVGTLQYLDL